MQEKAEIKISAIAVEAILMQAAEKELIILNELLAHKTVIEDLIISYYFKSRGRIFDVRLNRPTLDENCNGFFNVSYTVGHFNACADVDTSEEESMKIQLWSDLENGIIMLEGEYIPEREPDEF